MEQIKEQLRAIVNTPARNLSKDQKGLLEQIAPQYGFNLPDKKGCGSCWLDLAVELYNAIEAEEGEKNEATATERAYILKPNVDVYFGGIRINAATLTDELAERILARGFERKFFSKCK